MFDDLIGTDDTDGQPQPGPALMLRAPMGPTELLMTYKMDRSVGWTAPNLIVFCETDEKTGEDIWGEPGPPDFQDEGDKWQKLMVGWPRKPSVAEAMAFKANAEASLLTEWWDRLAAAKREDDERKPGDNSVGPAGRFAGEVESYKPSATETAADKVAALLAGRPVAAP